MYSKHKKRSITTATSAKADIITSETTSGTASKNNIPNNKKNNKSFSLKEPIEVGDKLIAMHNNTQDKLI